jgi:WD40 repeat protein
MEFTGCHFHSENTSVQIYLYFCLLYQLTARMNVTKKVTVEKIASFTGHRDCIYTIEQGPLPYLFYSAAGDGMVVSWNLQTPDQGELIARIGASVYALHFLPELHQLWIGQNFDGLHIIDLHTKKEIKSIKITDAAIFDIKSWRQDVWVATGDGTLTVVDTQTVGIKKQIKVSGKSARCIAINPVKGEIAVGYSDNQIRVFDLSTYKLIYTVDAHINSVFAVSYSPDYQYLISGSRDANLKIWHTSDYSLHQSIVAHMYAINHLVYSPSGEYFLSCSMDKSIKVWDAESFQLLKVIDRARHAGHGTSINKLQWTHFHNQIVACSDDRSISVWKLHFGQ